MDAKRIMPLLEVRQGLVTAPPASPADWARRLELAGADEILFLETDPFDRRWVREVAGSLFIPFTVGCATSEAEDLAELLEAGADAVLIQADAAALPSLSRRFGRNALRVSAPLAWDEAQGWRAPDGQEALAWLTELGQAGAGEIQVTILEAHGPGLAGLCEGAARLPMPFLVQVGGWAQGREALLHGADGLAYPVGLGMPADGKAIMEGAGLVVRR